MYDEKGEGGVNGEDKNKEREGEGGGCSCNCGTKAFIEQYGYAAYAKMTGQISDSEDSEDEEGAEEEEEAYLARVMRQAEGEVEDSDDDNLEVAEVRRNVVINPTNTNPNTFDNNHDDYNYDESNIQPINRMNVRPMNGMNVRPLNGMNIRPMNGMNVRPMNPSNGQFVRPIIINGRVVGSYVRPMMAPNPSANNQAVNLAMAAGMAGMTTRPANARPTRWGPTMAVNPMAPPMSVPPRSDDGTQKKNETLKRQQVDILDEASKRFRTDEK